MAKVGDFTTFVPTRFQTDAQAEFIDSSNSVTSETKDKTGDDSKIVARVPVSSTENSANHAAERVKSKRHRTAKFRFFSEPKAEPKNNRGSQRR